MPSAWIPTYKGNGDIKYDIFNSCCIISYKLDGHIIRYDRHYTKYWLIVYDLTDVPHS